MHKINKRDQYFLSFKAANLVAMFTLLSNRLLLSCFIAVLGSCSVYAQLNINQGINPDELVQMLTGSGVTISNIKYKGSAYAKGSFSGSSNLGLSKGIILTTGCAINAKGPNNKEETTCRNNFAGDPQLDGMAGGNTRDAAILEFDIVPQSDTLSFRYVFGSEEYPNFVGSFNDIFAFFISGPGISGFRNIALIPGTGLAVSINNVNKFKNEQFFIDNGDGRPSGPPNSVQYNGFTTVLTAKSHVIPCQTYHLKITIADNLDEQYDSGVFLEAGSIQSKGSALKLCSGGTGSMGGLPLSGYTYSWTPATGLSAPNSSRTNVTLTNTTATPYTINYILKGKGPFCEFYDTIPVTVNPQPTSEFYATPGCEDQTAKVVFSGSASVFAEFQWDFGGGTILSGSGRGPLIVKWGSAGQKTISLRVIAQGCSSAVNTKKIDLRLPLEVNAGRDTTICFGQSLGISAIAKLGAGNYTYEWNIGAGRVKTVAPLLTTIYKVTVKDSCGNEASDEITVNVRPPLKVEARPDTGTCSQGGTFDIYSNGSGGTATNYTYTWDQGLGAGNYFIVHPLQTTAYIVKLEDGCSNPAFDTVNIFMDTFPLISFSHDIHEGCQPLPVSFVNNSGFVPLSKFYWSFGDGTVSEDKDPSHIYMKSGTFRPLLKIVTPAGCTAADSTSIIFVKPTPTASFTPGPGRTTLEKSTIAFRNNSSGATRYAWNFGDLSAMSALRDPVHTYTDTGLFRAWLVVSNEHSCSDTAEHFISVLEDFMMYIPNAFTPNGDGLNDEFYPRGLSIKNYEMQIYNRWGQLVFKSQSNNANWNGKFFNMGGEAQDGVYVYQLSATDVNDKPHHFTGSVTLLR
jgi:gliding motility-associated-like protein